jgi:hypothetical protein
MNYVGKYFEIVKISSSKMSQKSIEEIMLQLGSANVVVVKLVQSSWFIF